MLQQLQQLRTYVLPSRQAAQQVQASPCFDARGPPPPPPATCHLGCLILNNAPPAEWHGAHLPYIPHAAHDPTPLALARPPPPAPPPPAMLEAPTRKAETASVPAYRQ